MDNRDRIICAAVVVFARKGFSASTISDLAKEAGIGEATIYNRFKNKADILLNLPAPYVRDFLAECEEQLRGLKQPEEKIRKFIWHTLRWAQDHRDHITVFLSDILPLPQFYDSEAHQLAQKGSQLAARFLVEGQAEGIFRKDVTPDAFIVFLFGTISHLILSRVMPGTPLDLIDDFHEIAGAIVNAVKNHSNPSEPDIHEIKDKKERILLAGEMLFSKELSVQITISRIAKTARVADGTIYDYFQNKEDLLFQIFNKRMKSFLATYQDTIAPDTPESKLKLSIYHFFSWVQDHRAWAKVFISDIVTNPRFYFSDAHAFKQKHDEKLLAILSEGQKRKKFCEHISQSLFLALFFGPIYFTCLPWALLNQQHRLPDKVDDTYALIYNAVKI